MPCETLPGGITICRPPKGIIRRRYIRCFNCETVRRVVQVFEGVWYGCSFQCVACGDRWMDGEAAERPFQRGWREKAIAKARKQWADALSPVEFSERVSAAVAAEFPEERAIEDVHLRGVS